MGAVMMHVLATVANKRMQLAERGNGFRGAWEGRWRGMGRALAGHGKGVRGAWEELSRGGGIQGKGEEAAAGRRHTWAREAAYLGARGGIPGRGDTACRGGEAACRGGEAAYLGVGGDQGGAAVCTLPLRVPIMALALSP
jgi:hypothetical protein